MNKADIDPNRCNNNVLRQAARRMGQLYDDVVAPSGLRATQSGLLAQIAHMGVPTMRELATALVMDLSALGHTLKPLIRDGLVDLGRDQHDGRVRRVALTAQGDLKLAQALALWRGAQDSFELAFGPERANELRSVLSYIASEAFRDRFVQHLHAGVER